MNHRIGNRIENAAPSARSTNSTNSTNSKNSKNLLLSLRAVAGLALSLLALASDPGTSRAGLVKSLLPGGSVELDASTYQAPTGTVVAQSTVPFTVHYQPDGSFAGFSGIATGQLRDAVLRDPATGRLTFLYHLALDNEGVTSAAEGSTLTVGGFGSYHTGVAGHLQFQQVAPVRRSTDGSTLRFSSDAPGLGGPPELAVTTNATRFDAAGSLTYALADEFRVNAAGGQELDTVWGQVTIKGVFRPTSASTVPGSASPSGPTPGSPSSVPLPPAFFTGIGVMVACALISLCRRALRRED